MGNTEDTEKSFKKILHVFFGIYVLTSVIYWLPQADRLLCQDYEKVSQYISLDDNWDITINDKEYTNVSLDEFGFDLVKTGDQITMQRTLPNDWKIKDGALRINMKHTAVRMFIDGEQIYEYGYDRIKEDKTVGSGIQFVEFPQQYEGKQLEIKMLVAENNVFSKFDSIRLYNCQNAYRALLTENRIPMFFGSFLTIFGLCILIITAFAVWLSRKFIRVFCIAAFSICMGIWTLCYYDVISVYSIPLYSISLIEYMVFYLAPLPLIIYLYENVKKMQDKVFEILYWVVFASQMGFDVVIFILHGFDIVHFAVPIKYFQILVVIELAYFVTVLVKNIKNSSFVSRLYMIGMLVVAFGVGYDLCSYYLSRYYNHSLLNIKGVSSMSVMFLVFIMIFVFYVDLTDKMLKNTERKALIKRAYTDELTQISNRRSCAEYMTKINTGEDTDYVVVCMDLNNLKIVNDTYGHMRGDVLIKNAADVIAQTFASEGVVGRMGGDEFIAILQHVDEAWMEERMKEFALHIARKNEEDPEIQLSIAYGYAFGTESKEKDIEKVYQIADNRMYENKKEAKRKEKSISENREVEVL